MNFYILRDDGEHIHASQETVDNNTKFLINIMNKLNIINDLKDYYWTCNRRFIYSNKYIRFKCYK